MPDKGPCDAWRKRPLYWSTIAYARAWWVTDGAYVKLVKKGLTEELLRQIAREYNFNRWLRQEKKWKKSSGKKCDTRNDPAANEFVKILSRYEKKWPTRGLRCRAAFCTRVAKCATKKHVSHHQPVSGTTKLMWFLRPDGWTPYDSYAAAGMGIDPNKGNAAYKMETFYDRLDEDGFEALASSMQQCIDEPMLKHLPATRILDTLLMGRAGRGSEDSDVSFLDAFVGALPANIREPLCNAAKALQAKREFADHCLTKPDRRARPARRKARS